MRMLTGIRRFVPKRLALGAGAFVAAAVLLVGGYLLWIVLRPPPDGFAPTIGQAAGVIDGQGDVLQYTVDARSRKEWAYFDFSRGATVSTTQDSLDWDLAFRRTDLLTNGGETNPAGRGAAIDLGEITLGDAIAPADGYLPDATDDERGLENPALHRWYSYNWTTHIVKSKHHTYAVQRATGGTVLLTFLSYYCDDGSPGCVTFQYASPGEG